MVLKQILSILFVSTTLLSLSQTRGDADNLLDRAKLVYSSDKQLAHQIEEEALSISEEIGYSLGIVRSNYYLGIFHRSLGDSGIKNSILHYLSAIEYTSDLDSVTRSWIVRAHINLGNLFYDYGAFDLAIAEFNAGIKLGKEISESNQVLRLLYNQQKALRDGQFYEEALVILHEILDLTETDSKEHFQALNGLGIVYRKIEDYPNSLKYLQKLLANYQSSQNNKFLRYARQANHSIGKAKVLQEKFQEARNYFQKAVEIDEIVDDKNTRLFFISLRNLGEVYTRLGQPEQALAAFAKAESLIPGLKNTYDFFYLFNHIANVYEELGQGVESLNYRIKYQQELKKYIELQEDIKSASQQFNMQLIVNSYYEELKSQRAEQQSKSMFIAIIVVLSTMLFLFVTYHFASRYYMRRMLTQSLDRLEWID